MAAVRSRGERAREAIPAHDLTTGKRWGRSLPNTVIDGCRTVMTPGETQGELLVRETNAAIDSGFRDFVTGVTDFGGGKRLFDERKEREFHRNQSGENQGNSRDKETRRFTIS